MVALSELVRVIVLLIVGGLIFWLLHWLVGYVGLPEPFNKVARVVLAVFAVLFVCIVLLSLVGIQVVRWQ